MTSDPPVNSYARALVFLFSLFRRSFFLRFSVSSVFDKPSVSSDVSRSSSSSSSPSSPRPRFGASGPSSRSVLGLPAPNAASLSNISRALADGLDGSARVNWSWMSPQTTSPFFFEDLRLFKGYHRGCLRQRRLTYRPSGSTSWAIWALAKMSSTATSNSPK